MKADDGMGWMRQRRGHPSVLIAPHCQSSTLGIRGLTKQAAQRISTRWRNITNICILLPFSFFFFFFFLIN